MNLSLIKIFGIILVSVIISLAYNYFNPKGLALIREERVLTWEDNLPSNNGSEENSNLSSNNHSSNEDNNSAPDMAEDFDQPKAITIDLAYNLFNQKVMFIDARTTEEFAEGHIKGAINIPFYGSENYQHELDKISKDEILITYCSGDDCDLSILLGDELFEKGYKKIYVFFGGWNQWIEKGYPIAKN